MLEIDRNGNIKLTRADTAYIDVIDLKDKDGTAYTLVSGDVIWFRLKGAATLLEKQLIIDTDLNFATLTLEPEDTEDLAFSTYKYEMELVTSIGEHFTFIAYKNFTIDNELEVHNGN